jgi:formiminotetrahydrofolate cyclodeaminase
VISDGAAAADATRAAATTARVNVEINLGGITDQDVVAELVTAVADVDDLSLRADKVTAAVRDRLTR